MTGRRAALLTAAVLLAAFAVVVAVATPWDVLAEPPGGATPVDPTAGLPAEQVDRVYGHLLADSLDRAQRARHLRQQRRRKAEGGVIWKASSGVRLSEPSMTTPPASRRTF